MLPTPFHPTPAQQSQILDALSDPTRSLRDIAHEHHTSTPALVAWLARPEIDAQVRLIDDASNSRLRLIAANCLPSVIAAAAAVLDTFNAEEKRLTPDPTSQAKRTDHKTDCRARANALRAANLIFRLSRSPSRRAATTSQRPYEFEPQTPPPRGQRVAAETRGQGGGFEDHATHTRRTHPQAPSDPDPTSAQRLAPTAPAPPSPSLHRAIIEELLAQLDAPPAAQPSTSDLAPSAATLQAEGLDRSSRGWSDESASRDTHGSPAIGPDPVGVVGAYDRGTHRSAQSLSDSLAASTAPALSPPFETRDLRSEIPLPRPRPTLRRAATLSALAGLAPDP